MKYPLFFCGKNGVRYINKKCDALFGKILSRVRGTRSTTTCLSRLMNENDLILTQGCLEGQPPPPPLHRGKATSYSMKTRSDCQKRVSDLILHRKIHCLLLLLCTLECNLANVFYSIRISNDCFILYFNHVTKGKYIKRQYFSLIISHTDSALNLIVKRMYNRLYIKINELSYKIINHLQDNFYSIIS